MVDYRKTFSVIGALLLLLPSCAYRDNPNDPQSPYYDRTANVSRTIDSAAVHPDTVCVRDTVDLNVTVYYNTGDTSTIVSSQFFRTSGQAQVMVFTDADSGQVAAVAPVAVVACDSL
jgi:hypothetical protein